MGKKKTQDEVAGDTGNEARVVKKNAARDGQRLKSEETRKRPQTGKAENKVSRRKVGAESGLPVELASMNSLNRKKMLDDNLSPFNIGLQYGKLHHGQHMGKQDQAMIAQMLNLRTQIRKLEELSNANRRYANLAKFSQNGTVGSAQYNSLGRPDLASIPLNLAGNHPVYYPPTRTLPRVVSKRVKSMPRGEVVNSADQVPRPKRKVKKSKPVAASSEAGYVKIKPPTSGKKPKKKKKTKNGEVAERDVNGGIQPIDEKDEREEEDHLKESSRKKLGGHAEDDVKIDDEDRLEEPAVVNTQQPLKKKKQQEDLIQVDVADSKAGQQKPSSQAKPAGPTPEQIEKEKQERERRDREERDRREREDRDRRDREKREKEEREKKDKEQKEKKDREDKERREREDREKREEKERREKKDREEKERKDKEERDKKEREDRERRDREERELKEKKEREEKDRQAKAAQAQKEQEAAAAAAASQAKAAQSKKEDPREDKGGKGKQPVENINVEVPKKGLEDEDEMPEEEQQWQEGMEEGMLEGEEELNEEMKQFFEEIPMLMSTAPKAIDEFKQKMLDHIVKYRIFNSEEFQSLYQATAYKNQDVDENLITNIFQEIAAALESRLAEAGEEFEEEEELEGDFEHEQ
jgi:hypothetical protein